MKNQYSAALRDSVQTTSVIHLTADRADILAELGDDDRVTELDSVRENDGRLGIWGQWLGEDFRLLVTQPID
jgi:hypothetical protein